MIDKAMDDTLHHHGYVVDRMTNDRSSTVYWHPSGHEVATSARGWTHRDDKRVVHKQGTTATSLAGHLHSVHGAPAKPRYWESEMNTRRADSLIRRALHEQSGGGTLFQYEPAGGGPTPVTGKMQSGGTLLPAVGGSGSGGSATPMKDQLGALKKAQDDSIAAGNKLRPIGAPMNYNQWWNGKAPMTGPDSKFGDGSAYGRPGDGSAPARAPGGGGSTMGAARPPSGTVQGTYPRAPRGGGRSNVGSMSRSEHVEVRGGGGSAAPAGGGRGASRITERRSATIVLRPLDEGNPYSTQPGNSPTSGGSPYATQGDNAPTGGGAPAAAGGGAPARATTGGTLLKGEPVGGPHGGGPPAGPRPGNTGSGPSTGGGTGFMGKVGGTVGSAVAQAVGQGIQGGKVDVGGMARRAGAQVAGAGVGAATQAASGAFGGSGTTAGAAVGAIGRTAGQAVGQMGRGGTPDVGGMARNVGGHVAGTAINSVVKGVFGGGSSR